MKFIYFFLLLPFLCGHSFAATVINSDIPVQCFLEVEYHSGDIKTVAIPAVGESIEVDLADEEIIRMTCPSYVGGGKEKTFCVVQKGMAIKTLKLFNQDDPFGDGPACTAQ